MSDDGRDRLARFVEDILAGPDELAAVLDAQRRAISTLPGDALGRPRWRLVGMGSSRYAALDSAAQLRAVGRDAAADLASASGSAPSVDTVLVAISSSGRTPEVVATAAHHRGTSFVVALTANPDSALAGVADAVVPLVARHPEGGGIATLTYRATVGALQLMEAAGDLLLSGTGIAAAVPALEALLRDRAAWLADAATALDTGRTVQVLGDGARIGTVEQAALLLREGPRIEATAWDTGDWLHGGLYTLFPGDAVLLLTGSAADDEAISTIHARGGRVVTVGVAHPASDLHVPLPDGVAPEPAIRALVEPAVAELLAAELWRRATAEEVGQPGPG